MQAGLFENSFDKDANLLPHDGVVNYFGSIFSAIDADTYFIRFLEDIPWQQDALKIAGKSVLTKRKVAWFGDKPYRYTYSRSTKTALSWTESLLELKNITEANCGEKFNSCLLNFYHSGEEGMGWHSDAEIDLKRDGAIASVSLGAERKFSFKHKQSKERIDCLLQHGSLLVMKGETQTHWLHALPVSKKIWQPRINLTFRTIVE